MKIHILELPIDNIDYNQAISLTSSNIERNKPFHIITLNSEAFIKALEDREFNRVVKKASLVVPDGIGIIWAGRFKGKGFKGRITGIDLCELLFQKGETRRWKFYFLGSRKKIISKAVERIKEKYPRLQIVGFHDGYFSRDTTIIKEISRTKPDILLVGIGSPYQDKWIFRHKNRFSCVCIGVGGIFDVFGGKFIRAPRIFRDLGLEWFWRMLIEPKRFKRLPHLFKFAWLVLKDTLVINNSRKSL